MLNHHTLDFWLASLEIFGLQLCGMIWMNLTHYDIWKKLLSLGASLWQFDGWIYSSLSCN